MIFKIDRAKVHYSSRCNNPYTIGPTLLIIADKQHPALSLLVLQLGSHGDAVPGVDRRDQNDALGQTVLA